MVSSPMEALKGKHEAESERWFGERVIEKGADVGEGASIGNTVAEGVKENVVD